LAAAPWSGIRRPRIVEVEIVAGEDHAVVGAAARVGTVDGAVEEVLLGWAEERLDVVVELGDDVGNLTEVSIVVWSSVSTSRPPTFFGSQKA
jgi:hypothetical protein